MANSKDPLLLIQRGSWPQDLHEIVRELQGRRRQLLSETDVLDFLFSQKRDDPETRELVRQIQRSLSRAIELNRRIVSLRAKHAAELECALYEEGEHDNSHPPAVLLEEALITKH